MRTLKYKTLSGLLRAAEYHTFTLYDFLTQRMMLNGQFRNFELSDELRDECLQKFASAIWERGAKGKACKLERAEPCGILRRVMIEKLRDGRFWSSYCAGQSYPDEIRFVQSLMNR